MKKKNIYASSGWKNFTLSLLHLRNSGRSWETVYGSVLAQLASILRANVFVRVTWHKIMTKANITGWWGRKVEAYLQNNRYLLLSGPGCFPFSVSVRAQKVVCFVSLVPTNMWSERRVIPEYDSRDYCEKKQIRIGLTESSLLQDTTCLSWISGILFSRCQSKQSTHFYHGPLSLQINET